MYRPARWQKKRGRKAIKAPRARAKKAPSRVIGRVPILRPWGIKMENFLVPERWTLRSDREFLSCSQWRHLNKKIIPATFFRMPQQVYLFAARICGSLGLCKFLWTLFASPQCWLFLMGASLVATETLKLFMYANGKTPKLKRVEILVNFYRYDHDRAVFPSSASFLLRPESVH